MTDQIKTILEKHGVNIYLISQSYIDNIQNAIIEICEEQKKQCELEYACEPYRSKTPISQVILNSKNIAE